ncbi:1-aminocyclopropane-1-carboxylate deaminase [Sulfurimonas sp.]|nr:1-aminocyclopropane-1-carboxylate deaminase [Sulfurimonas sp.]
MTPISKVTLDGRTFYIKRDDLYSKYLAGNKYRKLHSLLQTPSDTLNKVISYGGTQSNAMLSLASICHEKGWEFIYYTKELSQKLKEDSNGNFFYAKGLGLQHKEIQNDFYKNFISSLDLHVDDKTKIVHQGGADEDARAGLKVLAQEIREENLGCKSIATPSGTGTTALFLAIELPEYTVYTTPCVGDVEYLKEQMSALSVIPDNLIILEPKKKYHFAKPYSEFLNMYKKLLHVGIEFDLLYAPSMWECLLEQTDEEVIYVHSGGITGNKSMLKRYENKRIT